MHRRCASWHAVPLHTPSGVLHKNAFSDEAASFHSAMKHCSVTLHNMKHSAYAPYDEKMKNESCVCKYSLPMLHCSAERKMEKSSNKLVDLSIAFAVEILNLAKYLKEQRETIICNQIGRVGTSIGANIHEAQYAHGKADFVSKLQIALKETNETSYWLILLGKTKILSSAEYDRLETLCREIRITLIASINTTKQNLK